MGGALQDLNAGKSTFLLISRSRPHVALKVDVNIEIRRRVLLVDSVCLATDARPPLPVAGAALRPLHPNRLSNWSHVCDYICYGVTSWIHLCVN
jgi:hypothetical protein